MAGRETIRSGRRTASDAIFLEIRDALSATFDPIIEQFLADFSATGGNPQPAGCFAVTAFVPPVSVLDVTMSDRWPACAANLCRTASLPILDYLETLVAVEGL